MNSEYGLAIEAVFADVNKSHDSVFVRIVLGVVLRCMDGTWQMIWAGIDRVELKVAVTGIGDVMPQAGRDEDGVVVRHLGLKVKLVFARTHLAQTFALFNTQELIDTLVRFETDRLTRRDRHNRELELFTGPDRGAEVGVVEGFFLDVDDEWLLALVWVYTRVFGHDESSLLSLVSIVSLDGASRVQ